MICKICGKENENNSKFCIYCGGSLADNTPVVEPIQNVPVQPVEPTVQPVQEPVMVPPVANPVQTVSPVKKESSFVKDYFSKLKNYLLKPLDSINEEDDIKTVGIFGGIFVVLMVVVNLLMTMISSLKQTSYDFWTGKTTTSFNFENLGDLDYVSLIFKNLLIYAVVILAVAGIFYIGTLIIKKEVKLPKLLNIVFVTVIPYFLGSVVAGSILGLIYSPLATIVNIVAIIYSICIFAYLTNKTVQLDGMKCVLYNSACYATIILITYFVIVKFITSTISGITSGIPDIFG